MQVTRKIQIRIVAEDKEELGRKWETLREITTATFQSYNKCMNIYFSNFLMEKALQANHPIAHERVDLENSIKDLKADIRKLVNKAKKDDSLLPQISIKSDQLELLVQQRKSEKFKAITSLISSDSVALSKLQFNTMDTNGYTLQSVAYDHIKDAFPGGYASVATGISNHTNQIWGQYKVDVLYGNKSLPTFKKGCPIPTRKKVLNNFRKVDKEYVFTFGDFEFSTVNAYKDGSNKKYLEDVLNNWDILCDSKIKVDGTRIYFLMVVNQETLKRKLDPSLAIGVDLGISIPAVVAVSKGFGAKKLGSYEDLTKFKKQLRGGYSRKKSQLLIKGGNGRRPVDSFDDRYHKKERNYTQTYNHTLSRGVIDFALKYGAGVIKLEDLSFHSVEGEDGKRKVHDNKNHRMLSTWPYAELQTMIGYKAKMYGIQVEYVNPAYTSQECSSCGHVEKENRLSQSRFVCKSCGFKANADVNAAINIARKEGKPRE